MFLNVTTSDTIVSVICVKKIYYKSHISTNFRARDDGGGGIAPHFSKSKIFLLDTKHFYQIMITISLSFLSLGTNKYSGKCILGQPETLSFQNFLVHASRPPRRAQKIFLVTLRLKTFFGHPTFKNASRA